MANAIGVKPRAPRILVVEDELVVASLIADMLHSAGMLAKIALSACAGLLHAQQETFDLVICDLQMPGLDGRNFLAGLRQTGNPLCERILFITGDAQAADKQEFLRKNHAVCLAKPFRMAELTQAVDRMLRAKSPQVQAGLESGNVGAIENG